MSQRAEFLGRHVIVQRFESPQPVPFVIAEEEQLVPDDGTAKRAAELVINHRNLAGKELVSRVQVLGLVLILQY